MLTSKHYTLSKPRLIHLLEELKANSIEIGSLCVQPGLSGKEIEELIANIFPEASAPENLKQNLMDSKTGAMLFWGTHHRYLVIPPFPVTGKHYSRTCEIEPLYTLLHREILIGLVLIRLGSYAIGVAKGDTLLTSKAGTGLVHSRHRQGGSSSHRFERHREKQMETFFTRICVHSREQLEPFEKILEYLKYGGTRETVTDFRKQCHYLGVFNPITLDHLLNVREPGQPGLNEAIQYAWTSQVIQWD